MSDYTEVHGREPELHPRMSDYEKSPARQEKRFFQLSPWEIGALLAAFGLIAFVAVPNYFKSLDSLRGTACSRKITMLADCLQYLADKNDTQPGERICEEFDLNELLEQVQTGSVAHATHGDLPMYYKIGAEPDCPDPNGDHIVSLILNEDGTIPVPQCSLTEGVHGEYYRSRGWHTCNMEMVDGNLTKYQQAAAE